jgi:DNA-binding CsgD family transcriptional regulator
MRADRFEGKMKRRGRPPHPDILTPGEWEVLTLLREGLSNPEIANRLGVTCDAVKYHVSEILPKLGLPSREEAASWRPYERPWWPAAIAAIAGPASRLSPIWRITAIGTSIVALAGAGFLVVAPSGGEEEVVFQQDGSVTPAASLLTPGPGVTLWRWMDVSVLIPDESGMRAWPDSVYFDDGSESRPALIVVRDDDLADSANRSYASIDALTGKIHRSEILDEHRVEMELVLGTVNVSAFDPATAPWPYNSDPPPPSTTTWPSIRPDPATGMYASFSQGVSGYSGTPPPWVECELVLGGISVSNGRSHAFVGLDPVSGAVCKDLSNVLPEDLAAFDRFLEREALCDLQNAGC